MKKEAIKTASAEGYSNWEILSMLINEGWEFPDAVHKVSTSLNLPPDEVEEMERDYDENC